MPLERELLDWTHPFSDVLGDWLWERQDRLPGMLVIVPTAQSGRRLRQGLAEGVAVALLAHRPAPLAEPRGYAADVAEGVAWLLSEVGRLGFDRERVVLAGHGSGGQLATLVALDPSYLAVHGESPASLAAVVGIGSLYDLESSPDVPGELMELVKQVYPSRKARRAASPLRFVRADGPPVLALAAGAEIPGLVRAADTFTIALRAGGHPASELFVAANSDHYSILGMGESKNIARHHLLALVDVGPQATETRELWEVRRYWRDPSLSSEGFWERADLVATHEPRSDLDEWVKRYFGAGGGGRGGRVNRPWQAIPLDDWLEHLGPERTGSGRWLIVTNARGEQAVLDVEALRPYEPVLVVGIGEERNLFRVVDLYHTLRRYTWKQPEPERWLLARPLGAFLFFLKAPPRELVSGVHGLFALTPDGFALQSHDPLAPVPAWAPQFIEGQVRRNTIKPCRKSRFGYIPLPRTVNSQERILHEFLGRGSIAHDAFEIS